MFGGTIWACQRGKGTRKEVKVPSRCVLPAAHGSMVSGDRQFIPGQGLAAWPPDTQVNCAAEVCTGQSREGLGSAPLRRVLEGRDLYPADVAFLHVSQYSKF